MQVVAARDLSRLQEDIKRSLQNDRAEFARELQRLSQNDHSILRALEGHQGQHREIQELLVALTKVRCIVYS